MAEESHRLKPMKEGYDPKLFVELFEKTKALRKSLVYGIDAKRFGVDQEELLSWFDVKFIYVFNKYWDTEPERLLGYIINGLKMYKRRLVLECYSKKNELHATEPLENFLSFEEFENAGEEMDEASSYKEFGDSLDPNTDDRYFLDVALKFLRDNLSEDAYFLLEVQLNPPPFIINKLQERNHQKLDKLPDEVVADYMGIHPDKQGLSYLRSLKSELRQGIEKATTASNDGLIFKYVQ